MPALAPTSLLSSPLSSPSLLSLSSFPSPPLLSPLSSLLLSYLFLVCPPSIGFMNASWANAAQTAADAIGRKETRVGKQKPNE